MALFKGSLGLYGDNQRADVLLAQQLLMVASPYDEKDSAVERFWSTEPDGVAGDAFFAAIDYFCHEANADTLAGQNFYPTEPMHLLPGSYEETALQERAEMGRQKITIEDDRDVFDKLKSSIRFDEYLPKLEAGLNEIVPSISTAIEATKALTPEAVEQLRVFFGQNDHRFSERVYVNLEKVERKLQNLKRSELELLFDVEGIHARKLGMTSLDSGVISLYPLRIDRSFYTWGEVLLHEALHLFLSIRFSRGSGQDAAYWGESHYFSLQPEIAIHNPDSYVGYVLALASANPK